MAYQLVCTIPFHGYRKGDVVNDEATVDILSASHPNYFIRTNGPDAPFPAPVDPVQPPDPAS